MSCSTRSSISIAFILALSSISMPVLAATGIIVANQVVPKHQTAAGGRVSDRLIVKFKPGSLLQGMNAGQVNAQLSQPLSAGVVVQLQAAANTSLREVHATPDGAHVLSLAGQPDRQAIDSAIASIRSLSNVEYVEEDRILTAQAAPNDSMYLTVSDAGSTYPGLWGLWPVNVNAASAVGNPGSYGADFQDAWNTSTGAGVVVAVVDSGITPNIDIVGSSQTVAAGAGSNLVSTGYDFISDCRLRGIYSTGGCAPNTVSYAVAPTPDATDTGDYVDASDTAANPTLFPASSQAPSSWHGTVVAGIIAALGNNNFGVIGGAYRAKVLPVRVLGKGGGYESDAANGIMWAAGVYNGIANPNPARVINLSMGIIGTCSMTLQSAINKAVAAGAVVVVAAGNANVDAAGMTPANCNNVISVAAIGRDGSRASYSNFGATAVTLAAPGGDDMGIAGAGADPAYDPGIWSTSNAGSSVQSNTPGYAAFVGAYGTSMAAPHVSAAAALLLSKNPTLSPAQIKGYLTTYSTPFPSFAAGSYHVLNGTDCTILNNCGAGILNAWLAVQNTPAASGGGGGGGCSVMPFGADPDISLLLAILAVGVYQLRRRMASDRGAS